jgi:hypothetical protein
MTSLSYDQTLELTPERPWKKSKLSSINSAQNRVGLRATAGEETAHVLSRRGSVLSKGRILKADHFPSCRNVHLPLQLQSAPNIRHLNDRKIFGVGQPNADGYLDVLEQIEDSNVVWISLREEPFIFVNGHPYCVKAWKDPFDNIERTGISAAQVQADEESLRLEILAEAKKNSGKILLHGETVPEGDSSVAAMGEVYCYWEDISQHSVVCYHTLCEQLTVECPQNDNKSVKFYRVPVTDEHAFQEQDFDALCGILSSTPIGSTLIFNCQMGRGRATTGMVVASMLWEVLEHKPLPSIVSLASTKPCQTQFSAVVELAQLLGGNCVEPVNTCVDMCSAMQNIREAVLVRREKAAKYAGRGAQRKEAKELSVARHYLERYMYLVLYQAYLFETRTSTSNRCFVDWMAAHPNRTAVYTLISGMTLDEYCPSQSSSYDSEDFSTDASFEHNE